MIKEYQLKGANEDLSLQPQYPALPLTSRITLNMFLELFPSTEAF